MSTQDDAKLQALFGDADVLQDAKTGRLICSVQAIANLLDAQRAEIIAMGEGLRKERPAFDVASVECRGYDEAYNAAIQEYQDKIKGA